MRATWLNRDALARGRCSNTSTHSTRVPSGLAPRGASSIIRHMDNPSVSVVVPVFNGEVFLRESLDSILGQTHAPKEVIVMDDASTDSTPEIVASYGNGVRSVRQPANRGQFGNVNDGLALATGDLVGVFHADDIYLPELLEREVAWLDAHPHAGAVFCSDVFIDELGRELGRLALPPEIAGGRPVAYATVLNALLMYTNAFLRTPTALVRARAYREVGRFRTDLHDNAADLEMWLRIARRYEIGVLEDHLILYGVAQEARPRATTRYVPSRSASSTCSTASSRPADVPWPRLTRSARTKLIAASTRFFAAWSYTSWAIANRASQRFAPRP